MPRPVYIGIAEMMVSNDPDEILTAANLGSCLGISIYDPAIGLGGLIHCLLPSSATDPARAAEVPYMFVDSGVESMLDTMMENGAQKSRLQIIAAGAGQMHDPNSIFEIGKKNFIVLRKTLWTRSLLLKAEHTGGEFSRTISLDIGTGQVWVKTRGESLRLI